MADISFQDLSFNKYDAFVRVSFLKSFYFDISNEELRKIGDFSIPREHTIRFDNVSEDSVRKRFNFIISNKINDELRSKIGNYKAVYIHKNSGIPLIGTNSFGLVDRNTSIIEVKPITGCNLNCIFCSVDEGFKSKKVVDYVVEEDYLVEEFKKLAEFKEINSVEAHIGTQGEPLLYSSIVDLVKDIKKIDCVETISINTNGILLNKKLIDELKTAGLTRINLSLNALDGEVAKKLAGGGYDVKRVVENAKYAIKKMDLQIAPVWVPGMNDEEMEKIILFAKEIGCPRVAIQNFLVYKHGRIPARQMPWNDFYEKLGILEKKHGTKLIFSKEDFSITKTKSLPKPFRKEDVVNAKIICQGRWSNQALAFADDRVITVENYGRTIVNGKKLKMKILRSKHNIFSGNYKRKR